MLTVVAVAVRQFPYCTVMVALWWQPCSFLGVVVLVLVGCQCALLFLWPNLVARPPDLSWQGGVDVLPTFGCLFPPVDGRQIICVGSPGEMWPRVSRDPRAAHWCPVQLCPIHPCLVATLVPALGDGVLLRLPDNDFCDD